MQTTVTIDRGMKCQTLHVSTRKKKTNQNKIENSGNRWNCCGQNMKSSKRYKSMQLY